MIALERTVGLLLGAGLSRRFGAEDKLLAPVGGMPLVLHAARLLAGLKLQRRLAVVAGGAAGERIGALLTSLDFALAENPAPERGRESSLRIGLAAALGPETEAVLVLLGDMPFVTRDHIERLAQAATADQAAVSECGGVQSPPLLLPAEAVRDLLADPVLKAKHWIAAHGPALVEASAEMLRDFDTVEDFAGV